MSSPSKSVPTPEVIRWDAVGVPRKGWLASEAHNRTPDQMEVLLAMDKYKTDHHRPNPDWFEVFGVFVSLGYKRNAVADARFRMVLSSVPLDLEEKRFSKAMDYYKRVKRRAFPTCCEVLSVLRALGYRKSPQIV